ncbi:putative nucleotidyltransferase with HDIG domain [Paenibacillus taihuensis]|uniref:Putative nucleotidyltransferase with HDIG domain n=1 Tax=Paenibacillus taihuensis TaxID=1156355 RepID=A0A3D9Q2Y3_9BACL|nr:HD domain-containing phosphohydrolase [Paenibacillus taihuensis]REE55358.1 putative nucleotidyltransferase with HDIG domain [Paenibacillus taihuensis]
MAVYQLFIRQLIRNYFIGSAIAVLGVGSVIIFMTLELSKREVGALLFVLVCSLLVMFISELVAFRRHIHPIQSCFQSPNPSRELIQQAYLRAHRFPALAVRRIMGPHLIGGYVPAALNLAIFIHLGILSLPYYYIGLALLGASLVASMHAMVEFFLTNRTIRPLLIHLRQSFVSQYHSDLTLEGEVLISIQRKFQWSAFLIGTFPLFLLSLATQIRLGEITSVASQQYWQGAALILLIGILFSSVGAWLLSQDIVHPIRSLFKSQNDVKNGNFDTQAPDIYADEFSSLVSGFNHMVEGLKTRERMNSQLLQSYFSTLAAALDARDPYTAGHSLRVAEYSVTIARLAGLSPVDMDTLKRSALLHDIGKIGVRDSVLLKEGRLSDEEYAIIKLHPVLGETILKQIKPAEALADILPGVRSHHEHYNGGGYPVGLTGENIPLQGRIIAIADAFDAMTSDRPYRNGMPALKALAILEEGMGLQWDPKLASLFIQEMRKQHEQPSQLEKTIPFRIQQA